MYGTSEGAWATFAGALVGVEKQNSWYLYQRHCSTKI